MEGMQRGFGHREGRGRGCGPHRGFGHGRWGPFGGPGDPCNKMAWKQKKAILLSYPKQVLIGKPGEIIFIDIEVENGMNWPWKEGASLQSDYTNLTAEVLDEVSLPIDFPVAENSKFKFSIPIRIKDSAKTGEQIYEATFQFFGKRGNPFGEKIPVQIKV